LLLKKDTGLALGFIPLVFGLKNRLIRASVITHIMHESLHKTCGSGFSRDFLKMVKNNIAAESRSHNSAGIAELDALLLRPQSEGQG